MFTLFQQQHEFEQDLSDFRWKVIKAKRINREACREYKVYSIGEFKLTPQEEKFAKFFASEAVLVKDMDDLTLKAHREELAEIAFEARARLSAVDEEDRDRTKRGAKRLGPEIGDEDITSEAINGIKARQARMSKMDKVRKNLKEMGIPDAEIEQIISARNIREVVAPQLDGFASEDKAKLITEFNPFHKVPVKKLKPGEIDWDKIVAEAKEMKTEPTKPISFPIFGKKE